MNTRRTITIAAALLALVVAVGVIGFYLLRGDATAQRRDITRYADRELLIPNVDYIVPDVEEDLLSPRFYYFVDPERPLDESIVDDIAPDVDEAIRRTFTEEVESELEALFFDE